MNELREFVLSKNKPISSCKDLYKHFIGRHKVIPVYLIPKIEMEFEYIMNKLEALEKENQKYKEVIDRAVQLAYQYAQIDGGHHKMWVIDQMMRILLGSKYDNFVKEYEEDGEYEWNIGIAP